MRGGPTIDFRRGRGESSHLWVWEWPDPEARYYIGGDAARGNLDEKGQAKGDFSAAVCFNGYTGNQAFTFAARTPVTTFAWTLNALGHHWNRAMVNVEQTGGDGSQTQKLLRDEYHYPNLYSWMGKDDRRHRRPGALIGWETTWKSRQKMLVVVREAIRLKTIVVRDRRLFAQMANASLDDNMTRWEISRGHDDIFIAACLAAVARDQHPPPKREGMQMKLTLDSDTAAPVPFYWESEPSARLRDKWLVMNKYKEPKTQPLLEGI